MHSSIRFLLIAGVFASFLMIYVAEAGSILSILEQRGLKSTNDCAPAGADCGGKIPCCEVSEIFRSGKHKQAIDELQTLIHELPTDIENYRVHRLLGNFRNYMGQHNEAVQAWKDALQVLESNDEGIDKLQGEQLIDWINISIGTARIMYRQGCDGSGVSHKYNQVCYSSSKMSEEEESKWKTERIQGAIEHYRKALNKILENQLEIKTKIYTQLAQALFTSGDFDGATTIYEDAFNNDGNVECLYKAADCSWQQGKKEQAYVRLQQLIATEPTFAKAYKLCATYFTEKDDISQADELH
ncbi:hypothetical protein I4U23_019877 [Adineta vaga]|nr:hypothetical protein I4U23_019877 [Adineta vaga]